MASLSNVDLVKVIKNAYTRVHDKNKAEKIDRKNRPWLGFLEQKRKDSMFEGGAIKYKLTLSFGDPGTTWSGDDEIESFDPDFTLNLEFGYFNFTTSVTVKHDLLTRMGFSVEANGDGTIEKRAMGSDMAFKIRDYVKDLVEDMADNHVRYLDRLLLRNGAASPNDPVGLFGILTEDPTTGLVGGLSRVTYTQLRHVRQTGLTPTSGGDFRSLWDTAARTANQYSHANGVKSKIDFYMAGSTFIAGYKAWGELNGYRTVRNIGESLKKFDFAIPDECLQYEGIPVIWNPSMDDLDSVDTFSPTCTKLCIGINSGVWHYKTLPGKNQAMSSPADPPKQRITREDIDTTAHLACSAPASNVIVATD